MAKKRTHRGESGLVLLNGIKTLKAVPGILIKLRSVEFVEFG